MPVNYASNHAARNETIGALPSIAYNTLVSATTANTKTAWANIGATTSFDYEQLLIELRNGAVAGSINYKIGRASCRERV